MASDAAKLQKALYGHLAGDATLTALLGGAKIFDRPQESAALPYVTFGTTRVLDAGTSTEEAQEHLLTIHAWSRKGGRKEAMGLLEAVRQRVASLGAVQEGMRIVSLRFQSEDVIHDQQVGAFNGILRLRVISEPAAL